MPLKIIGGRSSHGRITIMSDAFSSTATFNGPRDITCEVRAHSGISHFLYNHKHLPIPQLVRLLLFWSDNSPRKWRFAPFLGMGLLIFTSVFRPETPSTPPLSTINYLISFGIMMVLMIFMILITGSEIGSWHGAEHMAISAFDREGSANLDLIARESPIHEKCGGRLAFPLCIGFWAANLASSFLNISVILMFLLAFEVVLWVDHLVGWDKIPITSQASQLIQRFGTTKRPGPHELATAFVALQGLIRAHENAEKA